MRILIAEDEVELARGLKFLLEKSKFSVDVVHNGLDALDYFHGAVYDAVVLDIMMPKMSGLDVLVRLREEGASVPVMMLTAKAEIEDRVAGLEAGADDYLPKPFASREFVARVRALVRRNAGYSGSVLSFGGVRLDCGRYELSCAGDRGSGAEKRAGFQCIRQGPFRGVFQVRQPLEGKDFCGGNGYFYDEPDTGRHISAQKGRTGVSVLQSDSDADRAKKYSDAASVG